MPSFFYGFDYENKQKTMAHMNQPYGSINISPDTLSVGSLTYWVANHITLNFNFHASWNKNDNSVVEFRLTKDNSVGVPQMSADFC